MEEFTNRQSQAARILKLLQQKRSVTNTELNGIAFRYGARIFDLRKQGYKIISSQVKKGVWVFTYVGRNQPVEPKPSLLVQTVDNLGLAAAVIFVFMTIIGLVFTMMYLFFSLLVFLLK